MPVAQGYTLDPKEDWFAQNAPKRGVVHPSTAVSGDWFAENAPKRTKPAPPLQAGHTPDEPKGPWTKYQKRRDAAAGPWTKYQKNKDAAGEPWKKYQKAESTDDPYANMPESTGPVLGADPSAEFQSPVVAPAPLSPLDYHPPGTENGSYGHTGDFADTYLRPVGNTGRAAVRTVLATPGALLQSARDAVFGAKPNATQTIIDLMHPLDAHHRAVEEMAQRGAEGTPYDPKAPVNYDRDLPEVIGSAAAQYAMAEATGGVLRGGAKLLPKVTPGALKEAVRRAGRSVLAGDAARTAVKDAATRTAESDATASAGNSVLEEQRARRKEASAELQQKTATLDSETKRIQRAAQGRNDANWTAVRDKVGDKPADLSKVRDVIQSQSDKMDPASQSIFRQSVHEGSSTEDIARIRNEVIQSAGLSSHPYEEMTPKMREAIDSVVESRAVIGGIDADKLGTVPFSRLQGFYTELGRKQFGGGMQLPGNVYKAIDEVRGAVRGQMDATAAEHGAAGELKAARESNVQFQEGFGRQRNKPLSAADQELKNANPQQYAKDRESARRGKIAVHDPSYLEHARAVDKAHERVASFPSEEAINSGVKAPIDAPTVDVGKVTRDAIETKATQWKSVNRRDVGMLLSAAIAGPVAQAISGHDIGLLPLVGVSAYEGGARALALWAQKPGVSEWFARPAEGEMEALGRIPGVDRVKIIDTLTGIAEAGAKHGRVTALAKSVADFLGSANARRVTTAIAVHSAARRTPRSAGEARALVNAQR